jgi:Holliday junction resolvase
MSSANKRKGSQWETDLVKYLRGRKFHAERLARTGRNDEGDVYLETGMHCFVVEAKNAARIDLAGWSKEANVEAINYAKHREQPHDTCVPVVVIKRRNSGTEKAYVVMSLENFSNLIE